MKITFTKLQFMHGKCSKPDCPICDITAPLHLIDKWVSHRLTVYKSGIRGQVWSPWWVVVESEEQAYPILKGDLRRDGFWDQKSC